MIYFIQCQSTYRIKIGCSADPDERMRTLQTGSASKLALIATWDVGNEWEANLHEKFSELRLEGEWFAPGAFLVKWLIALEKSKSYLEAMFATTHKVAPILRDKFEKILQQKFQ